MKKAKHARVKSAPIPAAQDLSAAILGAVAAGDGETFEDRVRSAVDDLPAHFLFHMRIDLEPAMDVAAIVTADSETADFLIVRQTEGEDVSIEPAASSDLPIAALIPAYAGLAATLPSAFN
ncbi:MAG: hypothetical protein IBJ07_13195 [Rhizobiaceae bacterium]|nr:hypothetical protein [Rhizobiaceae bacterium]